MKNKNKNSFFSWKQFAKRFPDEIASAADVFTAMQGSGVRDFSLLKFEFHFISDTKDKLEKLKNFFNEHYPYTIKSIKNIGGGLWELSGETDEIPLTKDTLIYWSLDMYKRGYEFDAELDAYGAPFDPKIQIYPDFDPSKEDYYFDKGIDCYTSGNLSGALFNWTITIKINPYEFNSYYSRAIVKSDLFVWKASLEDYNKAIEIDPEFASALLNRGALKDERGDYIGAIQDYNSVIALGSADEENLQMAYFNKGNSEFNLGNKEKACQNWKKAHELGAEHAYERISENCGD